MTTSRETYQAYVLRFQRSEKGESWRVTLYEVGNQVQHHFATVAEALAFLRDQLQIEET